jgi:hypothetical protein
MKQLIEYEEFNKTQKVEDNLTESLLFERKNELKKEIIRLNQLICIESDHKKRQIMIFDRDIRKCNLSILELKEKREILKKSMGN